MNAALWAAVPVPVTYVLIVAILAARNRRTRPRTAPPAHLFSRSNWLMHYQQTSNNRTTAGGNQP